MDVRGLARNGGSSLRDLVNDLERFYRQDLAKVRAGRRPFYGGTLPGFLFTSQALNDPVESLLTGPRLGEVNGPCRGICGSDRLPGGEVHGCLDFIGNPGHS